MNPMRIMALAVAAFVASTPAIAQSWEEYPLFRLPRSRFAVVFPANPQVEATTYQIADNRSVPAHIYSVRHNDTVLLLQVTVS
jgi:hypothetical protein